MSVPDAERRQPNIFLVEDDDGLRSYIYQVLDKAGYSCQRASSCEEGRKAFEKGVYGCVLIDLGLPDGDGQELLSEFIQADPCVVAIILTGDSSAETVIETMRAGAFDYLTKPFDMTSLKAAVSRALSHHAVIRERAELVRLLLEEREQLRARVEAATSSLRQSNAQLRALLELSRLASHHLTNEDLIRGVFTELDSHMPLRGVVLCDITRKKMLSAMRRSLGEAPDFIVSEVDRTFIGFDSLLVEAEPELLVQQWLERHLRYDTHGLAAYVYPQTLWNHSVSTVGFFLEPTFAGDDSDREFLGTCAQFMAFEWEQANLLLQVAHQASLGNIATELTRNLIQPLTAIRTAADFVSESLDSPELIEGMDVVRENVERLRRQIQEFRKLSLMREESVETVQLEEFIEQALDMLSVTARCRGVTIDKSFTANCECVLLNGTALARVFNDLILSSLRVVEYGGRISVNLMPFGNDHIAFTISPSGLDLSMRGYTSESPVMLYARPGRMPEKHPGLQLVERTVHMCGGRLAVETGESGESLLRIVLPRNATDPSVAREMVW